ncbi:MAG: hypothetical protein ACREIA_09315 [Opitutaceae bacterium]
MNEKESELARLSYGNLAQKMAAFPTDELVRLLNSKSVKVGDTATSFINEREALPSVVAAFDQHLITTRNGKMRVAYLLRQNKRSVEGALRVLLELVKGRVADVADNALFGIVLIGGAAAKNALAEIETSPEVNPKTKARIGRAIEAIEKNNPRIYSPNYGG